MKGLGRLSACVLALLGALACVFYLSAQSSLAAPEGGTVGTGTPGSCTEAALKSKAAGGGSVIFNCGASPYTITLTSVLVITANTSIDGGGKITLSGGHTNKVLLVNFGGVLTLRNISVADGRSALGGCVTGFGGLKTYSTIMKNCHAISSGFLLGDGGALAMVSAPLVMSNTQVLNNVADVNGGAIYLNGAIHSIANSSIIGNRADITYTNSGGGIYAENGAALAVQLSQVTNNVVGYTGNGGGIAVYTGTLILFYASLTNNRAENAGLGGGLYLQGSTAAVDHTTITGNSNVYAAGGIESRLSVLTVTNSNVSNNSASASGGGITTFMGSLGLSDSVVDGNIAGSDGGGIDLYDTPTTISRSTVGDNQGGRSGGGINHYRNTLTLNNVTVSGNSTSGNGANGGAIDNGSGLLVVNNSTLDHNSSSQQGGGIYNESDSISNLTNATLSANVAITGGGIYNEAGFIDPAIITLTNVTLKDNHATAGGGIFNAVDPLNFMYLKNTIIADSPSGGNCKGKAFTSSKYSLSTDLTCALAGVGNHNNTPAQLLALAYVGGPTKTHLPKPTSIAVDGVGGSDCPGTDQRGFGRPVGASCDIGSVERQLSDPAVVPILYLPLIVR